MAKRYDLLVIGTGTAATGVATRVRAAGKSVAVIDFRPFGGTCALRGCDPKKMMVGGASAFDHAQRMLGQHDPRFSLFRPPPVHRRIPGELLRHFAFQGWINYRRLRDG